MLHDSDGPASTIDLNHRIRLRGGSVGVLYQQLTEPRSFDSKVVEGKDEGFAGGGTRKVCSLVVAEGV